MSEGRIELTVGGRTYVLTGWRLWLFAIAAGLAAAVVAHLLGGRPC